MSSHPSAARPRTWRALAVVLAVLVLFVAAAGSWARWRPLSDDDAARLAARATVESVRADLRPDPAVLPEESLQRQTAALGPAATPSQTARLAERDDAAPDAVTSLAEAADRLARDAADVHDEQLAATMASVAAAWWAADEASGGTGNSSGAAGAPTAGSAENSAGSSASGGPATAGAVTDRGEATGSGDTAGTEGGVQGGDKETWSGAASTASTGGQAPDGSGCGAEELAAVTALDRTDFVAQAARPRIGDASTAADLDTAAQAVESTLRGEHVAALLGCEPGPVAAWYELPPEFQKEPARAVGSAERTAEEVVVRAVAAASPGAERDWWLDVLETTSRGAQRLDPRQPVTALPATA